MNYNLQSGYFYFLFLMLPRSTTTTHICFHYQLQTKANQYHCHALTACLLNLHKLSKEACPFYELELRFFFLARSLYQQNLYTKCDASASAEKFFISAWSYSMPKESRKLGICCAKRQRSSVVSLSLTARSEDNSCGRVRKKFFNRVILLFFLFYFFLHTCCAHHAFFCQNEQSLLTYDGAKGIGNPFKELKTSSSSAGRNKMRRQLQS